MKVRMIVTVTGLVQGVNFRYSTQVEAERLGVRGWVKNLPDGSVQGCFEGEEEEVRALVKWCGSGPRGARVKGVAVTEGPCVDEFTNFRILR